MHLKKTGLKNDGPDIGALQNPGRDGVCFATYKKVLSAKGGSWGNTLGGVKD